MYNLPHFKEKDPAEILAFMKAHPFAMLMGVDQHQQPVATQIPMLIKERAGQLFLQGHFMRQTDHHKAFEKNNAALVVFTGPHAYVSASWYENKQQASTWNYLAVHARGTLHFLDDAALLQMLDELTSHFEQNPDSPSLFKALDTAYVTQLAKAIVAFEVAVNDVQHVFKLSQNRDAKSFDHIVTHLKQGDGDAKAMAAAMESRKSRIFTT